MTTPSAKVRRSRTNGLRIAVSLVEIEPSDPDSGKFETIRALAFRKGGKLFVTHVHSERWTWTMPIDAKGRPPRGSDWAWRVADADVPRLVEAT